MSQADKPNAPTVADKTFNDDEDGAVTVDWVVLTAAVVGLAATGSAAIHGAVETLSTGIENEVGTKTVENGN